jgi:hypothetical protein
MSNNTSSIKLNKESFYIPKGYRIRPSIVSIKEGSNFRLFKRKNGELVLQKEFIKTTEYLDDQSKMIRPVWKDVETVNED